MKPITPAELKTKLKDIIPDFVIEAVNNLLHEKYRSSGGEIHIKQQEVVDEIMRLNTKINRDKIFDKGYLDFEELFEEYGWKVEYDKPGYNETYEAFFTFKPKRNGN